MYIYIYTCVYIHIYMYTYIYIWRKSTFWVRLASASTHRWVFVAYSTRTCICIFYTCMYMCIYTYIYMQKVYLLGLRMSMTCTLFLYVYMYVLYMYVYMYVLIYAYQEILPFGIAHVDDLHSLGMLYMYVYFYQWCICEYIHVYICKKATDWGCACRWLALICVYYTCMYICMFWYIHIKKVYLLGSRMSMTCTRLASASTRCRVFAASGPWELRSEERAYTSRSELQCVAVCCSALQCDAVGCSALQCVAV